MSTLGTVAPTGVAGPTILPDNPFANARPRGHTALVITEHAVLPVRPGHESEFEAAFALARPLISGQPGFRRLALSRSIESPNLYLLLVEWDTVEAHTLGFRRSPEYDEWKRLLHHFYAPMPTVEHFTAVP
jgi:heme-degrading monooxygenase HmoA